MRRALVNINTEPNYFGVEWEHGLGGSLPWHYARRRAVESTQCLMGRRCVTTISRGCRTYRARGPGEIQGTGILVVQINGGDL